MGVILSFGLSDTSFAYIDPGTTQTVVSSLGAILAAIGAGFVFLGSFVRIYIRKIAGAVKMLFSRPVALAVTFGVIGMAFGIGSFLYNYKAEVAPTIENKISATDRQKKMIILGIDGMDPKMAKRFMNEGKLPNFKKLAEKGDFKPLMTVNPVQSPVVWATMATGVGPGMHGITDFITRKENGYTPELSLVKHNEPSLFSKASAMFEPPVDPDLFFWQRLAANDVEAKVIRWPLTFPANDGVKSAKVLSGLGTPDLLGGMGTYTLFTTDPNQFPQDVKGRIAKLEFVKNVARTTIVGPKKTGLTGVSSSEVKLVVRKRPGKKELTIGVGAKSWTLKKNDLSPWIPLEFPVGFGDKLTGMVQFLVVDFSEDVHLYMSPVQVDPLNPAYPVASNTYSKDLAADIGRFHTLGMAEDTNALADEIIDEEQFVKICDSIMHAAEHMFFRELEASGSGLFSFVFDTVDRVQHMFWRFQDPEHPLYDSALAERYGKVIEDFYVRMDGVIGRVMEQTAGQDTTLLVVSDHGFTTYRRNFHVNAWLIDHGYMTLKDGHTESAGLFKSVDWSKTKAFALGFSQIFINVKGRDERGIVHEKDVPALKKEIAAKLEGAIDEVAGKRAVGRIYDTTLVYGLEPALGPDLLVGMEPGYRFSWQTAVGAVPAFTFEDNDKRWSGDHCVDPEHVPGVIFSNKKLALEHPSVIDVAPTALDYFGVERMRGMIGKNLFRTQDRHARKTL